METLNDRTPRHGTNGLRTLRSAAALLALVAGTATALAQPGTSPTTPPQAQVADRSGEVTVDENLTVELHVRDEELANVLQLLSLQSQRSIIAGPNVNATVTANLYGVTFYEALDAVLHTYGYGYIEQGNMIYVMTSEEVQRIANEGRLPVAKILHLNYLSSVDAAEYVSPLLSDVGEIRTNGRAEDFSLDEENPDGNESYAGSSMMIVFDYEENVAEIEALVAQIDTRPEQVLVEATILQASLREDNAFGVDFSVIGDLDFSEFIGGPLNAVNNMISGVSSGDGPIPTDGEGRGLTSTVGQTGQPGGLKIGIVDNDVAVFMRFLDEVTDTTVISNPKIVALNRQQGRVQVGRRIGYLQTTTTDTSTQQSVEFLDTGTQLSFRPWITADRQIRMELRPEVSRPFLRTVTDTNGNPVTIPDEDTSEIVTNVVVRDGQTIVLGGLFTESTVSGRRQWPWLGDVPILGIPFRGHNDTVERAEVIFMIKTTIMNDESLIEQGRRSMAYVDRVRMGGREGLLPWSRERRAGHLIVEAERRAAEGDMDGALYCVRRALAIQPMQPDAIRLRERLLSEPTVWPTRSMMEDIVNAEVDNRIRSARQEAMAEFTSLVRPDNRWNNLNTIPQQAITNVNTDSFATDNTDNDSFNNDSYQDEHFNNDAPAGETFEGQSFRNDGSTTPTTTNAASTNPYSWLRTLDSGNQGTTGQNTTASNTSSTGGTFNGSSSNTGTNTGTTSSGTTTASSVNQGSTTPATNRTSTATGTSTASTNTTTNNPSTTTTSSNGSTASTPVARTSSTTSPANTTNNQPQMFPFTQAQPSQAASLPSVQPDANGFYPIVSATNTGTANTSANTSTGTPNTFTSRLAWIFGAKGRQATSGNPAAQNTPGIFANVQENEGSQNP